MSTAMGCAVFVAFLLLATQTLVGLYASSVVGAVAADAASRVARSGGEPSAMVDSEAAARRLLGRSGEAARFEWSDGGSGDEIVLTVRTSAPHLFAGIGGTGERGTGEREQIDRTVRVRIERFCAG